MVLSHLLFTFVNLLALTFADDNENYFFYPPASFPNQQFGDSDPVWLIGSSQTIRWTTNLDSYNITLWQQNPNKAAAGPAEWSPIYTKRPGDLEIGQRGINWTVQTYGLDATSPIPIGSPIFFLVGGEALTREGAAGFVSYYLNFTDDASDPHLKSSSTSSPSSASATSSPSTSSNTAPVATVIQSAPTGSPISTPQATSTTSTHDTGLTSGSKAGIGVACGIGVPIIGLLAVLAFRREQRSRQLSKGEGGQGPDQQPPAYASAANEYYFTNKQEPVEANPEPMRHEVGEGLGLEMPGGPSQPPSELPTIGQTPNLGSR